MRVPAALAVLTCAVALAACGGDDSGSAEATATATAAPACKDVQAPAPKPDGGAKKPSAKLDASKTWTATVTTSCGSFTIRLDVKRAPKTSASFASLAKQGFFDDTVFHRIVPGFVIQGGDPTGTGQGGPGYSVTEAPPQDLAYTKGVVAMAKAGNEPSGASGSQFFVVTGDDAGLPPDYALLGKVTKGLDVVEAIGQLGDQSEQPTKPVVITGVTVASA